MMVQYAGMCDSDPDAAYDLSLLTYGMNYAVLEIGSETVRLIDDHGAPGLYPKDAFLVVDESVPDDWLKETYPDGDYTIQPRALSRRGFYERFFEGDIAIISTFVDYIVSSHIMTLSEWEEKASSSISGWARDYFKHKRG